MNLLQKKSMSRSMLVFALVLALIPLNQVALADGVLYISSDHPSGYDRSLFKLWIDADKNGCDTRKEVLISEAIVKPTKSTGCKLVGGKWISRYDFITYTDSSKLDIDHLVPLAEAWRSGAWAWTNQQRMEYANDLGIPMALNAVTASVNRSKGDRDITSWLPSDKKFLCDYLKGWVTVKAKYKLTVDVLEAQIINKNNQSCSLGYQTKQIDQSPTPTPTPTPQKIIFTAWASQFDTLSMTQAALDATSTYFGKVIPSNDYEITIDPAITTSDRAWITSVLDYANGLFTNIQREKIKVFLGTTHAWSKSTLTAANLWVAADSQSPYPCSQGINDAYCAEKNRVLLIYSDIYAPNSQYRWDFGRRSTPAHEVFHTVQFALAGQNVGGDSPLHIPRWLMEGSANYFGFYVADRLGFDKYQTGRNQQVNTNPAYKTVIPLSEYDNFNSDPYGIGQAASEYLIASVGFEKFLNIWKFTKSESNFAVGFKMATGITIQDFYSKFESARNSMHIGS